MSELTKEQIEQKAKEYAKKCYSEMPKPDKDTVELIEDDFKAGAECGYTLAKQEQVEEWISVDEKDKLPEIGEYVLVNVGTDTVLKGRLLYSGWVAFFSDGEKEAGNIRPVTHWRPLPNPPKITNNPS